MNQFVNYKRMKNFQGGNGCVCRMDTQTHAHPEKEKEGKGGRGGVGGGEIWYAYECMHSVMYMYECVFAFSLTL